MSGTSVLTDLMRQMNTPRADGFSPIPPRSLRLLRDAANPAHIRAFGWHLFRTVDLDPSGEFGPVKRRRTARPHDERGHLKEHHMAEDLHIDPRTAEAANRRAIELGFLAVDDTGRTYPRGDAPDAQMFCTKPIEPPPAEGEEFLYKTLSASETQWFQSLSGDERDNAARAIRNLAAFQKECEAEAMRQVREAGSAVKKSCLQSLGFREQPATKQQGGRPKKQSLTPPVAVRLTRVPSFEVGSVQNGNVQNPDAVVYETETGFVQQSVSIFTSSELQRTSSEEPIATVRAALEQYGTADDDAVRQLAKACRAKAPEATDEDIAGVIHDKMRDRSGVKNPIGFLLTAVPKLFERWQPPPLPPIPAAGADLSIEEQIATLEALLEDSPNRSDAAILRAELEQLRETLATTEAPQQC